MKDSIYIVYKPLGWTPLAVIQAIKEKNTELQHASIGFAGRLDPMAEGLLLLLVGDANKERKAYERLSKTYVCDILFGVTTDTYDTLGKVTKTVVVDPNVVLQGIHTYIPQFIGRLKQPYPPYSSPQIKGKSLFYWARNNRLSEITIPTKDIEVYAIEEKEVQQMSAKNILTAVRKNIALVKGDFRQEESIATWENMAKEYSRADFVVGRFIIDCSSGTYIRSLAHAIGEKIGCGACVFSLKRIRIGEFSEVNSTL